MWGGGEVVRDGGGVVEDGRGKEWCEVVES